MRAALVSTGVAVALALTAAAVKRSRDEVRHRAAAVHAAKTVRTAPSRKTPSNRTAPSSKTPSKPAARKPASRKTSAARG